MHTSIMALRNSQSILRKPDLALLALAVMADSSPRRKPKP